jgi:hypothetical protein
VEFQVEEGERARAGGERAGQHPGQRGEEGADEREAPEPGRDGKLEEREVARRVGLGGVRPVGAARRGQHARAVEDGARGAPGERQRRHDRPLGEPVGKRREGGGVVAVLLRHQGAEQRRTQGIPRGSESGGPPPGDALHGLAASPDLLGHGHVVAQGQGVVVGEAVISHLVPGPRQGGDTRRRLRVGKPVSHREGRSADAQPRAELAESLQRPPVDRVGAGRGRRQRVDGVVVRERVEVDGEGGEPLHSPAST